MYFTFASKYVRDKCLVQVHLRLRRVDAFFFILYERENISQVSRSFRHCIVHAVRTQYHSFQTFLQFVPALVILQFMMGNVHLTAEFMILRESKKFKVGIPLGCVTGDLLQSGQVVVNAAIHCSSSTSFEDNDLSVQLIKSHL